ncbi:MAG: sugar phosphate isomerase/epimerase [Planctomycetes bacterium]|nr:sugar phosphate isomerase/epimerase [Planctomycetota bacterium]
MPRKVTIFTGQWADLPFEKMCEYAADMGYDGLELACWGDHMDVEQAAKSKKYCADKRKTLEKYGLGCWAISAHLAGQLTCDPNNDHRSDMFAPKKTHGKAEAKRKWAIETMKTTAVAAKNFGVKVVNGFTGSPIWHMLYAFPPVSQDDINKGYDFFAKTWKPILDVYKKNGIKFALEVHPTEIAFDIATAERALKAVGNHPCFGFNYDPSHLGYQGVDYIRFIRTFAKRIFHCHMKDAWWDHGDGTVGVFGGHTDFGDASRYWDFRSLGHGDINFEEIIVALNDIGYKGPLSVEWEDSRMDRFYGAQEACDFVRDIDFPGSDIAFDGQFDR